MQHDPQGPGHRHLTHPAPSPRWEGETNPRLPKRPRRQTPASWAGRGGSPAVTEGWQGALHTHRVVGAASLGVCGEGTRWVPWCSPGCGVSVVLPDRDTHATRGFSPGSEVGGGGEKGLARSLRGRGAVQRKGRLCCCSLSLGVRQDKVCAWGHLHTFQGRGVNQSSPSWQGGTQRRWGSAS